MDRRRLGKLCNPDRNSQVDDSKNLIRKNLIPFFSGGFPNVDPFFTFVAHDQVFFSFKIS